MTEPNEDPKSESDQLLGQTQASLSEVNAAKALAVKTAAESSAAKTAAESSLEETKKVLEQAKASQNELLALLEQSKTICAKAAQEQKTKVEQLVEQFQATLGEVNQTKTAAAQTSAEAKTTKTEATATLQSTKQVLDQVNALLAQAKTNQQELQTLLEQSKTNSAKTAEIARTADEKETRVVQYEGQLQKLQEEYESIRKKIDDLLPGATSAGLAKAFNIRKKALGPTRLTAIVIFCISVLGFIGLGLWAIIGEGIKDWSEFMIFTIERSPIILGLIVLEEFSRRLFNNTLKLEEDYAYKETLSMAFDGYQKAMTEVQAGAKETLAHTLSKNVLDALKERPGRLLEHQEDDSGGPPLKALLAQQAAGGADAGIGLIGKVYEDLKATMRGSIIRVIIIIAVAIAIGFAVGKYSPSILGKDKELPTKTYTVPVEAAPSATPAIP